MNTQLLPVLLFTAATGIVGVYLLVRVAASAWFSAKRAHTAELMKRLDEEGKPHGSK